jgi:hypothetical protein
MNEEIPVSTETAPLPEIHEKPIIKWLAKSIFIDTVLEILKGIIHFFAEHIQLLLASFRFIWAPVHKGTKDEVAELMNRCQAVFGFLLTILGVLIFLVKTNMIDEPNQGLSDVYGNETTNIIMNIVLFVILAVGYFLVQVILILLGRLYRFIASPLPNTAAYDMLYISLGNQVFVVGALCGLGLRIFFNINTIDTEKDGMIVLFSAIILFFLVHLVIAVRLVRNDKTSPMGRKLLYGAVLVTVHSLVSGFMCFVLSSFLLGV